MNKVNSLEEARKHFFENDAEGQVPSVICAKDGAEKEVASFAEAEAFYAEASAGEQADGEAKSEGGEASETVAAEDAE